MPREIRDFFGRYRDAFDALDGIAVANLYAEPSAITQDGTYTHWPRRSMVADKMTALCQQYRDKGLVRADFEPRPFIAQGRLHAVADVSWRIE